MIQPASRLEKVEEYYFSKKLDQIQVMRSQGLDVINLGIGSPDLMPPPEAVAAATQSIADSKSHGYSSYRSSPELRSAIANWYQSTYQVFLNPNTEVLPLLGSKEGIFYLTQAVLNPGDQVLVPNPGYLAYASAAQLAGAQVISYDLTEKNHWLPDLESLEKQDLTRCKLMWVNYPHMPTGASCDLEFFKKLVAFARKKKILLCNDNPYGLVLNTTAPLSLFEADPNKEVSLELNSLSKSFNMPGWRVGMFLGAEKWVNAVVQVKSNVDSGMFLPIQKGAIAALRSPSVWHQNRNQIYSRRRDVVFKIFDRLGFKYEKNSVGLFVWAKAPDSVLDVTETCDQILAKSHIFLTPGMIFGTQGLRYARASLCVPEEKLLEALGRVERDFS